MKDHRSNVLNLSSWEKPGNPQYKYMNFIYSFHRFKTFNPYEKGKEETFFHESSKHESWRTLLNFFSRAHAYVQYILKWFSKVENGFKHYIMSNSSIPPQNIYYNYQGFFKI